MRVRVLVTLRNVAVADMHVIVVTVVVAVFVVVVDRLVAMLMLMVAAQHEAHSDGGDQQGDDFAGGDAIGEHRPGDDRSDERCGREHKLTSCCAEITSAGYPKRDRHSVPERADDECCQQRPACRRAGQGEADREVRSAGDDALHQRDVRRGESIELRR